MSISVEIFNPEDKKAEISPHHIPKPTGKRTHYVRTAEGIGEIDFGDTASGHEIEKDTYLPSTERENAIGSLVLAYHDSGDLVYVGRAGTGCSDVEANAPCEVLKPLEARKPRFGKAVSRPAARNVV